jgi:hypothetical protein
MFLKENSTRRRSKKMMTRQKKTREINIVLSQRCHVAKSPVRQMKKEEEPYIICKEWGNISNGKSKLNFLSKTRLKFADLNQRSRLCKI